MNKLHALTGYLVERQLVPSEQIDSWAEQVSVTAIWTPTEHGLQLGNARYQAVIVLERLAGQALRLMALVSSWLENHDPDRDDDLDAPRFDIEALGDDLVDVEITVEFIEPIFLSEDPKGEIEAHGRRWSFQPFELWVAEHGEVIPDGIR